MRTPKDKIIAALIAFFLGNFGVHKFYLRQRKKGIIYLLFCWTMIPGLIGIVEAVLFLFMSEEAFDAKYNTAAPIDEL